MGMKILGLRGWRFFAASFFLEHKTVFREAEDTGTGNSLRGAERLLHKPKLLMLMTEPHYRGPWIISLRQPQQLLLDCQGSDRHPTVCPSTQTLRMLLNKHGEANVLKKGLLFPLRDCCWSGLRHETLLLA